MKQGYVTKYILPTVFFITNFTNMGVRLFMMKWNNYLSKDLKTLLTDRTAPRFV
jgi:hypothetical protein